MAFYKVRHKETGLFWKGGGVNVNNKSLKHIYSKKSQFNGQPVDTKSKEHALEICFSKTGKVWTRKNHVSTALSYGHESGLNLLLRDDCEIVEYPEKQLTTEEIEKIFYSGIEASRLYWGAGVEDIDFNEIFQKALKGEYLEPAE